MAVSCVCLPAMDGDGGHTCPLDPLDQTDGVLQLKPVNNVKPVTGEVSGNERGVVAQVNPGKSSLPARLQPLYIKAIKITETLI